SVASILHERGIRLLDILRQRIGTNPRKDLAITRQLRKNNFQRRRPHHSRIGNDQWPFDIQIIKTPRQLIAAPLPENDMGRKGKDARHAISHFPRKIGATRFELATSWTQTRRSSQAELRPAISAES